MSVAPGIEPQRQAGVTQIVDPLGERRRLFFLGQRLGAGGGPRAADCDVGQLAALDAGEQAS